MNYTCHRCNNKPANLFSVCPDCREELIALKKEQLETETVGKLYRCSDCGETITTDEMDVYGYPEKLYFIHSACYQHDTMTGEAVLIL